LLAPHKNSRGPGGALDYESMKALRPYETGGVDNRVSGNVLEYSKLIKIEASMPIWSVSSTHYWRKIGSGAELAIHMPVVAEIGAMRQPVFAYG
jgi:hypothetical protein